MVESTQHVLGRVRPPRVQITYDVEIGGAIEKIELPFVVGILSDLSGHRDVEIDGSVQAIKPVKDRKFVEIDRDNFNEVLEKVGPRLKLKVPNRLKDDGSEMSVALQFSHMDDFNPVEFLKQIPALKELYEERQTLRDLLTKLDGNDELDTLLQEVVDNTADAQTTLRDELAKQLEGAEGDAGAGAEAPAATDKPDTET
ncbi:MAG: type VI secretion system contractile sheath small subunit [Rhodospirillales bacterium]|nr:MAG: type VI secretion system contractile sheath small subunit [Rhodospirillales bacterium]